MIPPQPPPPPPLSSSHVHDAHSYMLTTGMVSIFGVITRHLPRVTVHSSKLLLLVSTLYFY